MQSIPLQALHYICILHLHCVALRELAALRVRRVVKDRTTRDDQLVGASEQRQQGGVADSGGRTLAFSPLASRDGTATAATFAR